MNQLKNAVLVLMSTYNGEKYIVEQIDSIEKQQLEIPIDILIRDDGSNDNTLGILKKIKKKYKNIKIIQGKNIGCNASYFKLFTIAGGYRYYAISDQDDIWLEKKLQQGITKIEKEKNEKPILYSSSSLLFNNKNKKIKGTTQKQIRNITIYNTIIQNIAPGHSDIMNDSLLQLLKKKVDSSKIYVYDFWITNIAMLYGKIIFSNKPQVKYRINNNNNIGYGATKLEWAVERITRFKNGAGSLISIQIAYFYDKNKEKIPNEVKKEIEKYIESNKHFLTRLHFIITTKLFRQRKIETLMFKIAYLFGKYKLPQ